MGNHSEYLPYCIADHIAGLHMQILFSEGLPRAGRIWKKASKNSCAVVTELLNTDIYLVSYESLEINQGKSFPGEKAVELVRAVKGEEVESNPLEGEYSGKISYLVFEAGGTYTPMRLNSNQKL